MDIQKKIVKNFIVQFFGKILSFLLSFVSIVLLTRYLGPSGYGNFSLVFSYLSFFGFVSDMGLSLILVREISNDLQKLKDSFFFYLLIKTILTLFATCIAIFGLIFFPYSQEIKNAIILGSLAVAIGSFVSFGNSIFQAKLRMDLVTLIDQTTKFITVLFIVIFIQLNFNFYFIVSSVLIGNFFGLLLSLYLLKKKFFLININILFKNKSFKVNKKLIKNSLSMMVMTFLAFSYFKVDSIILSLYKPSADLGIYGLAYKIIENILLLWGFYMASIYPLFAKYFINDLEKYRLIFLNSIKISILVSFFCIFIGYFKSDLLIKIFGGEEFILSSSSLKILIFSVPFFLINNILYYSFISQYRIREIIISLFISLNFNIILNIIFVPKYSYIASSYVTLFTEILLLFLYLFFNSNFFKLRKI